MASLFIPLLLFFLYCFCSKLCAAGDTITAVQFITDSESVLSNGSIFKLGFFSPVNSTHRYVGIWYNQVSVLTVVWVANRDRPLNNSSGTLTVSEDGNLVVLDGNREILWSSNATNSSANSTAQLLDSGNLVLRDVSSGNTIWESFEEPTNTQLPGLKLCSKRTEGERQLARAWKSPSDPSSGRFSSGLDSVLTQTVVWKDGERFWRSGPWNGQVFIGVHYVYSINVDRFYVESDNEGNTCYTYDHLQSSLTNFFLDSNGKLSQLEWDEGKKAWNVLWSPMQTECDVYGKCGLFGICNSENSPICSCLGGYEPKNVEEWNRGNWTTGCVRRKQLQCERRKSGGDASKEDGFLNLKMMKVPDFASLSTALQNDCESQCLQNCSCIAYAYSNGVGCMTWGQNLIDTQKLSTGGTDLYIRVAYSELDNDDNAKTIIAITVSIGALVIAICSCLSWWWMAKQKAKKQTNKVILLHNRGKTRQNNSSEMMIGNNMNQVKLEELPMFKFEQLATATNNFFVTNKLGQGGFGLVYRGKLPDGQEIAVKRLSRASGQGIEEFMNEVVVISRLQHRNLVRLLGCCAEGEEKMLIYEYMPNKSLDSFLFDPTGRKVLDWRKRFNIIGGIARGLLYLHRDSRLRIIHRDLKASNILLDEELNPKISDFGMARIFGGNEDQANTRRVVGTYGYMSPEYAMEGRFSEKSDVFSFGVLLLEIVSGKKNSGFYDDLHSSSLLGFAWKMWNEDNIVAFIDPITSDPCFQMEILRCIHVGLLCVQEFPKDRPTISTVISMINGEIVDLPTPKQAAFTGRQIDPSSERKIDSDVDELTITVLKGR
ncbi:G-type lectin S-receptor-like serine/threonine-protein kinase At1g11300 [Malania oleifera]|uniref:G-type lectin S-receptor-like serine/threonine-protein kinase At1g11300 n=1 Tax=Malania oleifera TaxID=397392 RepID=UPI0025AEB82B|nr:G-type lectin S-receptor-like serine/threonine-protein kinase At1g11300 [Malania oleifera]XP_057961788.1 G-type lectin S-receptor-like serine/threonine-protein kinase At1g11300 [Malania oleifera]